MKVLVFSMLLLVSTSAQAMGPHQNVGALQTRTAWRAEALPEESCRKIHRSFAVRNTRSPTERRSELQRCLARASEAARVESPRSGDVAQR